MQTPASAIPTHRSGRDREARKELPEHVENQFVHISRLAHLLSDSPDQHRAQKVIHGLTHGFDIGYRAQIQQIFRKNNKSALENRALVSKAIMKEVERGHTAGPFPQPPFDICHVSPLGAAPKGDGSIRLIMDLSQPEGHSINDSISKDEFPTQYVHFDVATEYIMAMGRGCLLCKVDIKHAYRLLPVRPEDWPLLVYFWEGSYFVDLKLPFGGRSSSSIFTDFADLVCWIATTKHKLILIHYSDDYSFSLSPPYPLP